MRGNLLGQSRRLQIERLESRDLLAVTPTLGNGLLTITGDANRDLIRVKFDAATDQIIVQNYFKTVGVFDAAGIKSIVIFAGQGKGTEVAIDPSVTIATSITGGDGGDVLIGGGGPTTLLGGAGNDKLIAGHGSTLLDGAGGINHLVNVKPTDTVIDAPTDIITYAIPGPVTTFPPDEELTPVQVENLLNRAAAANSNQGAIIAVMDRGGRLLGVRVENGVTLTGAALNFAIDGAMAEARTAAFFASAQLPLTSRTIQFISQSTITQREVESDPNLIYLANGQLNLNSTVAGPGLVAPIEIGGHFPPNIDDTPQVDLFDIENTNRDSTFQHTGTANVKLPARFNINPAFIPPANTTEFTSLAGVPVSQYLTPPDSYNFLINPADTTAVGRGIGTLPGGIPIYLKEDGDPSFHLAGGIGVFFPGKTGYADEENSVLSANYNPSKPDLAAEAEAMAFAAVGGAPGLGLGVGAINGIGVAPGISGLPLNPAAMRVDLVGITLNVIGPLGINGPQMVFNEFQRLQIGGQNNGTDKPVNNLGQTLLNGRAVPDGWLVTPHDGVGITAAQVTQIIQQGLTQANMTRAAIRLPFNSSTKMVFAVSDLNGNLVGLYRMPDATIFSIAVAVAKSRNVAYYNNAAQLQSQDQLPGIRAGTAFTNRSFRYLAEPHYPEGINSQPPGPFSILNDPGTNPITALDIGPPQPLSAFNSIQGHNAFVPDSNFHDPFNPLNQDGIVFFPGSSGVYQGYTLIGGFGVSGDGVDQDDVVTTAGIGLQGDFAAPSNIRIDQLFVRGVRVPYSKFLRNPEGGIVSQ